MKAFILAFLALCLTACATTPAHAWIHGIRPTTASINFGADTPPGFGGASYTDLGYGGAAGTLSIVSQTNGSATPGTYFDLDGDSNLVPHVSGGAPYCVTTPCVHPLTNGPYTVVLTGTGLSKTLTINLVAARADFTSMCVVTSTPPTCSDLAQPTHPDAATSSQLRTLVADRNAYAGDETLVGRNTPTFGLQLAPFGVQFAIKPPAGPYPGFLWITSEYASTAIYPQALVPTGGGSVWGQVNWDVTSTGDVDQRAGTAYITHYTDYPNVVIKPLFEKASATSGFGFIVDHDDFSYGPDTANAYQVDGFNWLYRPSATSPCDPDHPGGSGVACVAATVRDSTFHNVENSIQITSSFSAVGPTAGSVVLRNAIWGQMQDAIDYMPGARTDIEFNFITLPNACCKRHADSIQGFGSASQNGLGANQSAGIVAKNIVVRGRSNLGATVASVNALVGGAGYAANGTYTTTLFSGGTGQRASGTVVLAGGVVTSVTPDVSETEGSDAGGGYAVGQVLTPIPGTGKGPSSSTFPGGCSPCASVTVASVQGRTDFQGPPFYHDTNVPFTAPLTSLTWSAGTVTATTSSPITPSGPPYYVNIDVNPAGGSASTNGSGYNSTFVVNATGVSTFTFALAANPGAPASLNTAGWGWDRFTGGTIANNIYMGVYGNGVTFDPIDNSTVNFNLDFYDVTAYHATNSVSTVGIRIGSNYGADGANLNYNAANVFASNLQTGTITCLPGLISTNPKCNATTATLAAYQAIIPGWNTDYLPTRASVISMITPSAAVFAARSGAWPVTPPDSTGHACWNVAGLVYDVNKTCAGMGTSVAG